METDDYTPVSNSFGSNEMIVGAVWSTISFDVLLCGGGAAGTAPNHGPILRAAGWAQTIAAGASVTTAHLLNYRSELPRNLVPPETACLVLVADTQQASFYYELWALGYAPQISAHMMRHGIVESFHDLEGMLDETYSDHTGKQFRISSGLIDSGGTRRGYQKHSRTVEVYEWCSRNRQMMPIKGMRRISCTSW